MLSYFGLSSILFQASHLNRVPLRFWIGTALAFLALVGIVLWSSTPLEVHRHDLRANPNQAGLRVVQLSDLHLQSMDDHAQKVVRQVKALRPDLVVLSGDMVDRADALLVLAAFLKAIGPVRMIAVPGNWEHWSDVDFDALGTIIQSQPGGRLLLNERWSFKHGDRRIEVVGLDDFTAGQPDLRLLAPNAGADVSLLVQHSPGFFDKIEVSQRMDAGRFSLCLSGHTHGGQIAFGGWAPFRTVGSGRFVSGFYDVPGCPLFVSKGVGTSVLPVRFGVAPEVVVFEL